MHNKQVKIELGNSLEQILFILSSSNDLSVLGLTILNNPISVRIDIAWYRELIQRYL